MSEQVKNTLFRFVTMRAPELITEDAQATYFLSHPDGSSGSFFEAVTPVPIDMSKRESVEDAAASFAAGALSLSAVKGLVSSLFAFSIWLMKNRKTITQADAATALTGTTALSAPQRLTLWDNLFYQTITQSDLYIREAIIQLLIADYFKLKFTLISGGDDDATKKLAQIRVVLPEVIFKLDENYHTATTNENSIPNTTLLNKYLTAKESIHKANLISNAAKEMSKLQAEYNVTKRQDFYVAIADHNTAVNTAMASATIAEVTDQFTGFTVPVFTDYVEPVLNFSPAPQIVAVDLEATLSDESYHVLDSKGLLSAKTFNNVSIGLQKSITAEVNTTFANLDFKIENVVIDGTPIRTCSLDNRYNQKYSFLARTVKNAPNKYTILMSLNTATPCIKMDKCTLTVGAPVSQTYTKFTASNSNGIFSVEFNPGSFIPIPDATSTINISGQMQFNDGLVLSWNDTLVMADGVAGLMTAGANFTGNSNLFIPSGYGLTRIGIADYRKVEQYLCCYEAGEVCHIENIMAREYKEKSTRRLRSSEETTTTRKESERENLTDTTSTSRFEMNSEVSAVLSKSTEFGVNANVHAGASGTVGAYQVDASVDVGANYATNTSRENSDSQATNFAKDVTEKALDRVVQKVYEERVSRVVEEFEEQNKHGVDNRLGAEHISGVFRWVDKIYKNEIHNFGKRLQYEFMIPEPAAFHLISKSYVASSDTGMIISKPVDPTKDTHGSLTPIKSAGEISIENYQQWAAVYNAEVTMPPAEKLVVGKSYGKSQLADGDWNKNKFIAENVVIPEGYGIEEIFVSANCTPHTINSSISIGVADTTINYKTMFLPLTAHVRDDEKMDLDKYSESVPVSVYFEQIWGGIVQISLELIRKPELFVQWQLDTFRAILLAYEARLQDYKDQMAELEAKRGLLMAENPAYYRQIINTVLKKNCISYLVGHSNMGKSFINGNEMRDFYVSITAEMDKYAATVKFIEQAFEWDILSYKFYPFYWASQNNWHDLYGYKNDDPIFREFIQSGMARTIVTVRPGFEEAVMHYMATGQVWNGGEVPAIGDPLHLSIIEELKDPVFVLTETWKSRVPSTLTVIQAGSIGLDASGLPCWCDGEEPVESFGTSEALGTAVYIEGYTPPPTP